MRIALVNTSYNLPLSTRALLESARQTGHNLTIHLFLHSTHPETRQECQAQAARGDVFYYPYGVNRGLSRSWNEGIWNAYDDGVDVVVVANDDVEFGPGDLDKLVEKAAAHRDCYIVTVAGYHAGMKHQAKSHGYSCFAINPIAVETLGAFDENIFPIYLEDCDYAYRAGLAGLSEENCPDTNIRHGGSSAINNDARLAAQNRTTHALSGIYYRQKWGGENGREVYKHPFNNLKFDYHIAFENRRHPYGPDYDRVDSFGKIVLF